MTISQVAPPVTMIHYIKLMGNRRDCPSNTKLVDKKKVPIRGGNHPLKRQEQWEICVSFQGSIFTSWHESPCLRLTKLRVSKVLRNLVNNFMVQHFFDVNFMQWYRRVLFSQKEKKKKEVRVSNFHPIGLQALIT